MKLEWKNLNLLEESLIKFLNQKYPHLEYTPDANADEFLYDSIYRAGQRDVIKTLEHILELQKKEKSNG
jgi:hypothetical protein